MLIPAGLGNILENAFAFIVKQGHAAIETDGEIGLPVVVIITDGAPHAVAADIEFRGFWSRRRICRRQDCERGRRFLFRRR